MNCSRECYDHERQTISFSNLIPSDVKNNPWVILPKPRSEKEEVELTTRATLITKEVQSYLDRSEAQPENLTKSERRGLRKLKKRIQARELVVLETDKSGSLCTMPLEMYMSLGSQHTKNDPEITWDTVRETQRIIKGHLRALNRIFRPGKNTNSEERVWEAEEL